MTPPSTPPERIDLARADDPRDVVHRAIACLAHGGCVAVSCGDRLFLGVSALRAEAVARLAAFAPGRSESEGPVVLLRDPGEVGDWVPDVSRLGVRLTRRAWPAPVVFEFATPPGTGLLHRLDSGVGGLFQSPAGLALNVPEQPFLREVLRLSQGPVVGRWMMPARLDAVSANAPWELQIDDDLSSAASLSWVRVNGESWHVRIAGGIDAAQLTRMAATTILFVCTGNTCRSPMAEALCKVLLAERLGCSIAELPARGYLVGSAGIAAIAGMPAASNALDVIRHRGGSLQDHVSRRLTLDLLQKTDHVLAMTADHLDTMLLHAPQVAERARLLHPHGEDVADPIGSDRETYQQTAAAIEGYLRAFLDEVLADAG